MTFTLLATVVCLGAPPISRTQFAAILADASRECRIVDPSALSENRTFPTIQACLAYGNRLADEAARNHYGTGAYFRAPQCRMERPA